MHPLSRLAPTFVVPTFLAPTFLLAACGTAPAVSSEFVPPGRDASAVVEDAKDPGQPDGGSPDVTPTFDTGQDAASTNDVPPEEVPDGSPAGIPPEIVAEACESACIQREQAEIPGCDLSEDLACEDACTERASVVDEALFDAYVACIAGDPMCFQTLLQCVVDTALPEPTEQRVVLDAAGFVGHVGLPLEIGLQEAPDTFRRVRVTIPDDTFVVEIDVVAPPAQGHRAFWFVDVDEDGECTPGRDVMGSSSFYLWSIEDTAIRIPEPRFGIRPDADRDAHYVCDTL